MFDPYTSTPLCEIMERNKSDKGSLKIRQAWHNYTTFYFSIFNEIKDNKLRIFELGLGTNNINLPSNMGKDGRPGASLYGWSEFFKNSLVYGADIDKDILFTTEKIKTFFCDQTNKTIIDEMWMEPELNENFDIIIEDGLHKFAANVCFFENSVHKLKVGGYFIIEDITSHDLPLFESKVLEWKNTYTSLEFNLMRIPCPSNTWDNNLLVVKKLDDKTN
jgi:hypothetical protein